jgi:ribonucleoside-diphosphate reductase alpha chain
MKKRVHGVEVDLDRDKLFDELGLKRLRESYMKDDETSPQERFAFVSKTFSSDLEHAQRLYEYSSKHWLSYSTPILSFGRSQRGLPISCFLPYLDDSSNGLVDTLSEVNWLSMLGGGIGIGVGIRSADDKSTGVMAHLKTYDASCLAYRQGRTRRGSYAAYLDINHPDITMFIEMRKPTGDQNVRVLNLHHGVNITDDFMNIIEKSMVDPTFDDSWELKDPHDGKVREVVSARELWQKILETRMHTGEPYLHFIDTSNNAMPAFQKSKGLKIRQSNLCVTGDTMITVLEVDTGKIMTVRIDDYTNNLHHTGSYKVWSHNIETDDGEWKEITNAAMTNSDAEILEIEDDTTGKIIKCTPEHKIYTKNRGYVMAKDLKEDDDLVFN